MSLVLPVLCAFCKRQQVKHHCDRKCGWWRCAVCLSFGEIGGRERAHDARPPKKDAA